MTPCDGQAAILKLIVSIVVVVVAMYGECSLACCTVGLQLPASSKITELPRAFNLASLVLVVYVIHEM